MKKIIFLSLLYFNITTAMNLQEFQSAIVLQAKNDERQDKEDEEMRNENPKLVKGFTLHFEDEKSKMDFFEEYVYKVRIDDNKTKVQSFKFYMNGLARSNHELIKQDKKSLTFKCEKLTSELILSPLNKHNNVQITFLYQ